MNVAVDQTPIILSWADVAETVDVIAGQVRDDRLPDVLVGVLRGGLVPAVLLSHGLGVREMRAVEVVHTLDDSVNADKSGTPQVVNPATLGDLTGMDVLLVDDIAGSGDTLVCTVGLLQAAGAKRVRSAVLTVNRANWRRPQRPADVVTYLGHQVGTWVIFPWEASA
ncbi:phosphoribosyltransferase family protein [Micromonospora sp. NPDC050980]|uniref:phosphoribosyltransferase n=1 Tax=Micromonospora sp. NPDC050980 TaxID=3155161 RepID=UPI0033EDBA42